LVDQVRGDGLVHVSNQATVWRWREAFQNDFAARIAWSVTPDLKLSALGSRDPDRGELTLRWWQYREAGGAAEPIALSASEGPETMFEAPMLAESREIHVILEGRNSGPPPLTRYRRAIVTVRPNGSIASAVVAGRDIPILSGAALAAAAKAGFECRWCVGVSAQYSIVYQFTMGGLSHDVRLEPVCETAGRSRVTTWADSPICDHCGGHVSSAIRVRSAKCGWLWKCGVRYR